MFATEDLKCNQFRSYNLSKYERNIRVVESNEVGKDLT